MPGRFFMEGISEANVVGVAAGLALEGRIPYVNTIATFITRRCFEQLVNDLCIHNVPRTSYRQRPRPRVRLSGTHP